MRHQILVLLVIAAIGALVACTHAMTEDQISQVQANCNNVDDKIAMLEKEKETNDTRVRAGVGNVFPITALKRFVMDEYKTNAQISSGDWARMIDVKLAELRRFRTDCSQ